VISDHTPQEKMPSENIGDISLVTIFGTWFIQRLQKKIQGLFKDFSRTYQVFSRTFLGGRNFTL
jgi:hypothetical protein